MDDFCREKGIKREYSVARTPQQNGVAERKNRTLIEAARTIYMLIEHVISDVQSSVQTRRMTTSYSEQGFLSAIYEGKTHHIGRSNAGGTPTVQTAKGLDSCGFT
ncbi:putative ribonuclease H-like domain-containing protein [Tanacetum coccineum]